MEEKKLQLPKVIDLDENGDFKMWDGVLLRPYYGEDIRFRFSGPIELAAIDVHENTTVGIQRKIDADFKSKDFGARVIMHVDATFQKFSKEEYVRLTQGVQKYKKEAEEALSAYRKSKGILALFEYDLQKYSEAFPDEIKEFGTGDEKDYVKIEEKKE